MAQLMFKKAAYGFKCYICLWGLFHLLAPYKTLLRLSFLCLLAIGHHPERETLTWDGT